MWVTGLVVVAAVPTKPGEAVTTFAGAVHAAAATLAIFALLAAEVVTAFTARSNRLPADACAFAVVAGLTLSRHCLGSAREKKPLSAHAAWLLSIGGDRSAGGRQHQSERWRDRRQPLPAMPISLASRYRGAAVVSASDPPCRRKTRRAEALG